MPMEFEKRLDAIADQIGLPGTETENSILMKSNGVKTGLYCCLPASCLTRAQMLSVSLLTATLKRELRHEFLNAVKEFRSFIPSVPEESFYLSRIAIDAPFRNQGLGGKMLEDFYCRAKGFTSASLHVKGTNRAAIEFYKNFSFTVHDGSEEGYLALTRKL